MTSPRQNVTQMIFAGTISENFPKQHIKKVGRKVSGGKINFNKFKMAAAFSHILGII